VPCLLPMLTVSTSRRSNNRGNRKRMLTDKKILITGVTGKAVLPIATSLAARNEVWGLSRFSDPQDRNRISALGIKPCAADLAIGDLSEVPSDFDHLLHFAWMRGKADELETALKVNVEGAGLILHHCRNAKSALVTSSLAVYAAHPDPLHLYRETDPIGPAATSNAATSPLSKAALEAMARFCSRTFSLPVIIPRLNTVLGPHKAYHGQQVQAVLHHQSFVLPGDPNAHSPIHSDDMILHIEPFLEAAIIGGNIVNWGGDEVVTSQQTLARIAERTGIPAKVVIQMKDGGAMGNASDAARRRSITGPCTIDFWSGLERLLDEMVPSSATSQSEAHSKV
jgi:UDP-glucuronate 4-epimerase